ncbi:MAG TPA: phosphoribosyltransferase family protein [Nitrosopumilaceae archaeon]|jgi:hypoxanthine phosphoribosyltransferase|nr:phosphoribosyltransferase family protein [Nitrosopumilaceae archaeon]
MSKLPEKVSLKLLYSKKKIEKATKELANQIAEDMQGESVVMVAVLNAGAKLMLDLVDQFPDKTERFRYDFISAKSYEGTKSQGWVTVSSLISSKLTDRVIIVVDLICDSGRTLEAVCSELKKYKPKGILTCALLKRKGCPFPLDYFKFTVQPGKFLVGRGLDIADAYRWLPEIFELKEQ